MADPHLPARGFLLAATAALVAAVGCGTDPDIRDIIVRVEIQQSEDTLSVGDGLTLAATAFNVSDETVETSFTWSSLNSDLATVDPATGLVTGVSPGRATIEVRAGDATARTTVVVVNPVALRLLLDTLLLAPGDSMTLPIELTLRPNARDTEPAFASDDPAVAGVNSSTGLITAVAPGSASITVTLDTLIRRAGVEVIAVPDTGSNGSVYALGRGGGGLRFSSRGFVHPTSFGDTVFTLNAVTGDGDLQLATLVFGDPDPPRGQAINLLSFASLTTPGADPVCRGTSSWAVLIDPPASPQRLSLSLNGTFTVTSIGPITGGRMAGGRFDVNLREHDAAGEPIRDFRLTGTFVVPVLDLDDCPT